MTLQLVSPPSGPMTALPAGRPKAGAVTGGALPAGAVTGGPAAPPGDLSEAPDPPAETPDDPVRELTERLAERTADLRRLKAEYDNYRRRVRRDRLAVREVAVANVLVRLLPVLDALDAARGQGRLDGGLAAVAEVLESELAGLGLRAFGEPGEPFDPTRHTAVAGGAAAGETVPVCAEVVRRGYRVGEQLLRPAEVVVSEARDQ